MHISQILKEKRTEHQLTQEQLAEKLFVSKKSISNWETERTMPDIDSLIRLARLFDLSLDHLLLEGSDIVEDMKRKEQLAELTQINYFGPTATGILLILLMYMPSEGFNDLRLLLLILASAANLVSLLYLKGKIYQLKDQSEKLNKELKQLKFVTWGLLVLIGGFLIYLYTL